MNGTRQAGRRRCATALCGALLAGALAGCYPVNPALRQFTPTGGYRFQSLGDQAEQRAQNETFVVLAFSGGGTRAAAFAYGALEALKETDIGAGRSLLDEVDIISSVSGGSFAAAYLGLFGQEKFFAEFPSQVLHRPLESGIIWSAVNPLHWPELLSPYFGRGDLADRYYDSHVFEGKQFKDLPRHRPFIVLNATDIERGAQFAFTQDSFDRLCSNLDEVAVSRGVTASSAFPVAFTPLTVKNYGPRACRYEPPEWVADAERGDFLVNPQRHDLARTWRSYEDVGRRPSSQLSDGGLADNIGLRGVESGILSTNALGLLPIVNMDGVKRLVVIVVDAKPRTESGIDRSARPPGIYNVLNAAATNPMENYSAETVERFRLLFQRWDSASCDFEALHDRCDALAAELCAAARNRAGCIDERRSQCQEQMGVADRFRIPHPALYLMHVRFEAIPDSDVKQRLQHVDTRLQLPADQIDLLITWGRRLVGESCTYAQLVDEVRGEASPPDPCTPAEEAVGCDRR
jgi:NTE family protein